jgi:hypothetical protein
LELCEGLVDHGGLHDLVEGVFVLELRVRVVLGVGMVDTTNFGEVFELGAIPCRCQYVSYKAMVNALTSPCVPDQRYQTAGQRRASW